MTDAATNAPPEGKKFGKKPLIIGVVLMIIGGIGGYFATSSGLIPLSREAPTEENENRPTQQDASDIEQAVEPLPDIEYVALDPVVVTMIHTEQVFNLRFRAQLEVNAPYKEDVEKITPRIIDVLNSYLRALEIEDFKDGFALTKIRGQLLRRFQAVAGKGRIRDVLVMDFTLN